MTTSEATPADRPTNKPYEPDDTEVVFRGIADLLEQALFKIPTPSEWHWQLWRDVKSCRDRAESAAAPRDDDAVPF